MPRASTMLNAWPIDAKTTSSIDDIHNSYKQENALSSCYAQLHWRLLHKPLCRHWPSRIHYQCSLSMQDCAKSKCYAQCTNGWCTNHTVSSDHLQLMTSIIFTSRKMPRATVMLRCIDECHKNHTVSSDHPPNITTLFVQAGPYLERLMCSMHDRLLYALVAMTLAMNEAWILIIWTWLWLHIFLA